MHFNKQFERTEKCIKSRIIYEHYTTIEGERLKKNIEKIQN
jgi:hypothetical protein